VITTRSPGFTSPVVSASSRAARVMSSTFGPKAACLGMTPKESVRRRTVPMSPESAMTGWWGLYRATNRGVVPEEVGVMMAAALSRPAVW